MKNQFILPIVIVISTSFLGACRQAGEKEAVGTVIGATAGGVIGSQFGSAGGRVAGTAIGAVIGGIAGNALGRRIDEQDRRHADRAFDHSSRTTKGEIVYWHNGRTGNFGSYVAVRDGHSRYGNYCREFAMAATINGRYERVYQTACRKPNGTWYYIDP